MKRTGIALTAACIFLMLAVPALPAAGEIRNTFSEADRGRLIITCRNLSGSEDPVRGAVFEVDEAASLAVSVTEDGEAELVRESLIFDKNGNPVVIGAETNASELEDAVKEALKNGRTAGYHTTLTTDEKGQAAADGLPPGIYLVRETHPADGYLPSKAFLVSVPKTAEDGISGWEFEVEVFPKPEKVPAEPSPPPAGNVKTGDSHAPLWILAGGMMIAGTVALWAVFGGKREK